MDKGEILETLHSGNNDEVKSVIAIVKIDKILSKFIKPEIFGNKNGAMSTVKRLFEVSKDMDEPYLESFFKIYRFILNLLRQNLVPINLVCEFLCTLLIQTEVLLTKQLVELSKLFTEALEKGDDLTNRWIELYPKVITTLASRDEIKIDDSTYSGSGFRSFAIDSLISLRWRTYAVPHIVSLFIDIGLTEAESLRLIEKSFKTMKHLDIMDTPVLILHLLHFAEKVGQRRVVQEKIINFFNNKDKCLVNHDDTQSTLDSGEMVENLSETPERLLEAEGNAILHVSMSIERNMDALKDLLKILNANKFNPEFSLSPFCLALCLSKKTPCKKENASTMEFLKSAIIKCFEENNFGKKSAWSRNMALNAFDIEHSIMTMIKNSKNSKTGWDFVLENLVELGLDLIKSYGSKTQVFRTKEKINLSSSDQACVLGQNIILETYKTHNIIAFTVLEKLLNLLYTRSFPAVFNIINLVGLLIKANYQPILSSSQTVLKQYLEHLQSLELSAALALLNALMPLLKYSAVLRDYLMIVLRKALFYRVPDARKVSIMGYLLILKNFRVLGTRPFTQSQESTSSAGFSQVEIQYNCAKYNVSANEGLCYELLQIMKRGIEKQQDKKTIFYQQIPDVMLKNPNISVVILEIQLELFNKYYKWNEDVHPPVALAPCVEIKLDAPVLVEPIGDLINSICMCLINFEKLPENDDEEDSSKIKNKLYKGIRGLLKRILESQLEDFELDKTSDFSNNTSVGLKNQHLASQLLGIIEALMDWVFKTGSQSLESCKDFIALYNIHQKIFKIVTEKMTAGPAKQKGKNTKEKENEDKTQDATTSKDIAKPNKSSNVFSSRQRLLSLEMISELFQCAMSEESSNEPDGCKLLRHNESLMRCCLETVEQAIQNLKSNESNNILCDTLSTITRCTMKIYSAEFDPNAEDILKKKNRRFRSLNLLCMDLVVKIVKYLDAADDPSLLHKFLTSLKSRGEMTLDSTAPENDFMKLCYSLTRKFHKHVIHNLGDKDENTSAVDKLNQVKEIIQMINFIQILSCRAEFYVKPGDACNPSYSTCKWARDMCIRQKVEDPQISLCLMNLYLELSHQHIFDVENVFSDVSFALVLTMESSDSDRTLEGESKYKIIHEKSAGAILLLLIQHLEKVLGEVAWTLEVVKMGGMGDDHKKFENRICKRLGTIISSVSNILQIALKSGIDTVAKFVTKLYQFLSNFTKYNITLYNKKLFKDGEVCQNFEKLVRICGKELNPPVQDFISYVELKGVDDEPAAKKRKNLAALKSKVLKETKQIPSLVCEQELFYHNLLALSKKSKIDLCMHIKMSASLDFRIDPKIVQEALMENDDDDDDDLSELGTAPPPSKKPTLQSSNRESGASASKNNSSDQSGASTSKHSPSQQVPVEEATTPSKITQSPQTARRGKLRRYKK